MRQYLADHEHSDVQKVILKHKEILGIPTARLFEQISVRKKAKDKLPLYYNTPDVIYPPQENFEQCSSERTALFKSNIIAGRIKKENTVGADLTAGFGVDSLFLSKKIGRMHAVEPNESLLDIARFNHHLLDVGNIDYHCMTAEEFLDQATELFDVVYIDPSRRTAEKRRTVAFEDTKPDIMKLAPDIIQRTNWLMIKASPLLDIQAAISQIPRVKDVFVVSVDNECKELLLLCNKDHNGTPAITAVNLLDAGPDQIFTFTFPEERATIVSFREPGRYLYEPNASILKAGAFKSIATRYHLGKMHANTHLYTADVLIEEFPGRRFRVGAFVRPDRAEIRKHIPDGHANVTTRNYPLSPDALKKKTGLKDGGEKFLIAFSGDKKKYVVIAERV